MTSAGFQNLISFGPTTANLRSGVARERLNAANKRFDRLENEKAEFHARVRQGFLKLAESEPSRFLVLDASLPVDELAQRIRARVEAALSA